MQQNHQNIRFASNGRHAYGYLAAPSVPNGSAVVVIQEWWGLTGHIRDVTDRFANAGYVALAPDLFGGSVAHDRNEAKRLMAELPLEKAVLDLSGAARFLLGHDDVTSDQIGAIGFCMGGSFVLAMAAQEGPKVGAIVAYYPVGPIDEVDLSSVSSAVLAHFAELDTSATPQMAEQLEEALKTSDSPEVRVRIHNGVGHAFFNEMGERYDAATARDTWEEGLEFLQFHLGEP